VLGALLLLNSSGSVFLAELLALRVHGGRGRIRTSVARKERQIYSLLVLATHPPVLENSVRLQTTCPTTSYRQTIQEREGHSSENTKRTRVKRHQPVDFALKDSLPLNSPARQMMELAEGIEPPTL
jgi:hypothetical protein